MNLFDAPFQQLLTVKNLSALPEDSRLVLQQMGLFPEEKIEKLHTAPLGDPIAIRIGEHAFSLRKELCKVIQVESV